MEKNIVGLHFRREGQGNLSWGTYGEGSKKNAILPLCLAVTGEMKGNVESKGRSEARAAALRLSGLPG